MHQIYYVMKVDENANAFITTFEQINPNLLLFICTWRIQFHSACHVLNREFERKEAKLKLKL